MRGANASGAALHRPEKCGQFRGSAYATIPVGPPAARVALGGTTAAPPAARRRGRDQEVLPAAKLVHRGRSAGRRAQRKLPQLLAAGAVVDVDLAVSGRNEDQPRRSRDNPALGGARRARAFHALSDEAQIVAEPDLPPDRALVEIVRGQRGYGGLTIVG